ncbi:MAG: polyamine aminopropyltransferase [bacterium]
MAIVLLFSIFIISICGLVYELLAGTLASYLLGDSVTQFSTIIGVYLFSMGMGAYLSKFVHRHLTTLFIQVELLIGLIGGFSAALLFLLFEQVSSFRILLYTWVILIGTLVGFEIPLLMRILKDQLEFKDLVSKVFTFDYIGALVASLLFPLLLVPHLGLVRTSFLFGLLNVAVALWALYLFRANLVWNRFLKFSGLFIFLALLVGFVYSNEWVHWAEASIYAEPVLYAKTTPYQRIVLTHSGDEFRLYLNSHLQFNSRDEYRYHEGLVHVGLARLENPKNVLVLGGGDGMAVREILKYPTVESVTLVDLDPEMTRLFSGDDFFRKLNQGSLVSPKVHVINHDAFLWLKENSKTFDFIVVDFPDPTNYSLGKLYTTSFYRLLYQALSQDGVAVIQSTSPLSARKSYWCVNKTLEAVGFQTLPYHVYVPSFGEWGFLLAAHKPLSPEASLQLPDGLRFIRPTTLFSLFDFPPDMNRVETQVNQLNNQALVRYYEEEWARYANRVE